MTMEDDTREEFDVKNISDNSAPTKEVTVERLKEFAYYFTENVEKNLNFCLKVLEQRPLPKKANSDPVTAVSMLATPIPYVGRGIGSALKEGEIYILDKIDKKNSRKIARLVFYFDDNRELSRQMLIESSMDVFYSFETQFMKLDCDGGPRRAMQKLAKDAANRVFTYFLEIKQDEEICRDDFSRGVIQGSSLKNKVGMKSGKTVENEGETWKTADIFTKVGLFIEETEEFFQNKHTKSDIYGYRRIFDWEDIEEIRKDWSSNSSAVLHYNLTKEDLILLCPQIREYSMSKNAEEEAELDREKKHQETMEDGQLKHEEIMKTFLEKFDDVLEDLLRNYSEILVIHQQNKNIHQAVNESDTKRAERQEEIHEKLADIHKDVLETKDGQIHLQQTTENIKHEICAIRTNQDEISSTTLEVKKIVEEVSQQKNVTLSDLVKDNYEVKKVTKLVNEVKKDIDSGKVETKVRKEVERSLKKIFRRK